jgi:signal peptidase I
MRILKGFLYWLPRVLAGFAVILAILIGTGVVNARVVLSDSMEPVMYKNDVVLGLGWLKPQPGDIAIYQERDAQGVVRQDVVHRVITLSAAGEYMFKGDNNQSSDALLVPKDDVKGVILMKIPGIGSLMNPLGALQIVGIIGGIWAIAFGFTTLRKNKHVSDES